MLRKVKQFDALWRSVLCITYNSPKTGDIRKQNEERVVTDNSRYHSVEAKYRYKYTNFIRANQI